MLFALRGPQKLQVLGVNEAADGTFCSLRGLPHCSAVLTHASFANPWWQKQSPGLFIAHPSSPFPNKTKKHPYWDAFRFWCG